MRFGKIQFRGLKKKGRGKYTKTPTHSRKVGGAQKQSIISSSHIARRHIARAMEGCQIFQSEMIEALTKVWGGVSALFSLPAFASMACCCYYLFHLKYRREYTQTGGLRLLDEWKIHYFPVCLLPEHRKAMQQQGFLPSQKTIPVRWCECLGWQSGGE